MPATRGVVTAGSLNVRPDPSTQHAPVGRLTRGTIVEIVEKRGPWYHVKRNRLIGFVHGDHLTVEHIASRKGVVTARQLNVRDGPSARKRRVGQLRRGTRVEILSEEGNWYRVRTGDVVGYVHGDFIAIQAGVTDYLYERDDLRNVALEPMEEDKIRVQRDFSSRQKIVGWTWNRYGGLLNPLSDIVAIDSACSVAVLTVESSGSGFGTDGRMIIRFESHIFWRQWGRNHQDTFNAHFRYDASRGWRGHKFRAKANGRWSDFHGKQSEEWRVFEFARRLNEAAALCSISMGAPQIMGFNFAAIGYESARDMYDNFQADMRYQIVGLFDFLRGAGTTSPMVQALQRKNFIDFAGRYNGPGQAAKYGAWIERDFEIFNALTR